MNFHILTLFPEMVMNGLNTSIIGRAVNAGHLSIEAVNIRDYAFNKHQSVDDYPYGGGAGMLMQAEPVYLAHKAVAETIQSRMCDRAQGRGARRVHRRRERVKTARRGDVSGPCTCHLRDRYSIRRWQRNWRRKRI